MHSAMLHIHVNHNMLSAHDHRDWQAAAAAQAARNARAAFISHAHAWGREAIGEQGTRTASFCASLLTADL